MRKHASFFALLIAVFGLTMAASPDLGQDAVTQSSHDEAPHPPITGG